MGKEGYEVKSFLSGKELLKSLTKKPGIVIIGQSFAGNEVISEIKANNHNLPVIVLSETSDNSDTYEKNECKYISQTGFFLDKIMETVEISRN